MAAPDNIADIDLTRRIWFTTGMAGGLNSKRKKRTIHSAVTIDDVALRWELTSEPQWSNSGDGYKGLCISVEVVGKARRELKSNSKSNTPIRKVATAIRCRCRSAQL